MRLVKSFNDVQQVLRDLETAVNEFRSKQWDLNQRRITNVHPSRDEYDVVVRKELFGKTPVSDEKPSVSVPSQGGYDTPVFGVGINTNAVVGYDVCPRFISAFSGTIVKCFAVASFPATGLSFIFDIKKYHGLETGISIFTAPFEMVDGDYSVQTTSTFASSSISEGDTLGFDVVQVGNNNPGSMVVVKLKIKRA